MNNNQEIIKKSIKVAGKKESRLLEAFFDRLVTKEAVTAIEEAANGFLERGYGEDDLFFALDIEQEIDRSSEYYLCVVLELCTRHGGIGVSRGDFYIDPRNTKEQNEAVESVLLQKEED